MDKPALEMSISKYKGTASLICLAWVDEFQNPDCFHEKDAEYIDPEERRLRDIYYADIELSELRHGTDDWIKARFHLNKLLQKYAVHEVLPLSIENYYPNEIWLKSGPELALRLARANMYQWLNTKVSKSIFKNLDHKRAYYFDAVKHAAYVLTDFLLEANDHDYEIGTTINLDYSDNYDLKFHLDSEEPLSLFISTIKTPSDRDIFETAKSMVTKEKYHVVKFADTVFEFSGLSNFKSMERSLAKGRKPI